MALMPNEPAEQMHIEYTPEFKRNLRALAKKYRHIRSDVQPVIDKLEVGEIVGVQVPRTPYTIFKVRVRNSDIQKGKRSGYRMNNKINKEVLLKIFQNGNKRIPCRTFCRRIGGYYNSDIRGQHGRKA
jgi:mRNA-degrading endonuclease RelE of RelBE toxin-antitoxin system